MRVGAGVACLALTGCAGSDEPEGDPLPAESTAILTASARAMGDVTSVRFTLDRSGSPVYIDTFESLALDSVDGRFTAPASADAVLTVEVDGSLKTQLGAVAIDDTVWLSNPVTGIFEPLPDGYDIDPSRFFDPEGGWRPLLAELQDPVLVGEVDRDGERYQISGVAPADNIEIISAGLVRDQDVAIDFWIHTVTGLVTAAEFTTTYRGADTDWVLELGDYGETFEIEPPQVED
ncbi:MAG TPA: LppX_LprAFG lipoprotein [Ilumatobacteraceae bacterium]|nr:LppX_LprAFG lipoprotein [Ilumatobacteraceae bacterium]